MNEYTQQYQAAIKQQWQEMDWTSKCAAIIVISLLMVGGFFTGFFILSLSLVITLTLYIKTLIDRMKPTGI